MNREEVKTKIQRLHKKANSLEEQLDSSADPDLEELYEEIVDEIEYWTDVYHELGNGETM